MDIWDQNSSSETVRPSRPDDEEKSNQESKKQYYNYYNMVPLLAIEAHKLAFHSQFMTNDDVLGLVIMLLSSDGDALWEQLWSLKYTTATKAWK